MNLKQLRKSKNLYQKDIADYLGIERTTYVKYENNTIIPNIEILKKLAEFYDVTVDYIIGADNNPTGNKSGVKIPVLGRVAAGIPIDAIEEIIDYEEVTPEMAKRGKLIGLQIKGSSMEPKICDGDIVIIKCQDYIDDNHIGIVMVNGSEATCKKIKFSSAGITLISLNPAFEPIFYSNEEIENLPVRIFGEVIELRRKF